MEEREEWVDLDEMEELKELGELEEMEKLEELLGMMELEDRKRVEHDKEQHGEQGKAEDVGGER